ncbi:amino acid ABC transporter substrate-binding protein [Alteromonas halophila]|uniref:Amino acid ABC transporter substrate-binding protein n=1 Tax=Alteromonas halophila TaxID=516698 RepID=A0A918N164_9ALTE|nr:amino acid ABC transporter substrate-binding protein [Alteromonas halophila]GGW92333.1 hypothetical protein GCM10007391_28360 [Alteromonas halophila]
MIGESLRRLLTICVVLSLPVQAGEGKDEDTVVPSQVLRIPKVASGTDPIYNYITALLSRVLSTNASEYGQVRLHPNPEVSVQERQLRNLQNGLTDVTWSVTSIDRERKYRPIRIPLVDGFFGKRVLLIATGDRRFSVQPDAQQLKDLYALQGYDWPDTRILLHNGFRVIEAPYQASHRLLIEGFADYFPRSLVEAGYELQQWQSKGVSLEPYLLLSYRSAMFFFVSKDNEKLAKRIEEGLQALQQSGEFSALLHRQPFYKKGLELVSGRHEIVLENPLLSDKTEAAIKQYLPFIPHE